MKNLQGRLAKTVAGTSGLKLANLGLSFVVSVLLSRLLGAEGYGNYAYAMSWVFVLLIPATMGFNGLIVREIAMNQSRQAWGLIQGILRWSNLIVLFTSVGIALLAAVVAWGLRGETDWETLLTFWVALILLPFTAFTTLRLSAMIGLHRIVLGQLPEQLIQPLLFIAFMAGAYLLLPEGLDAPWVMGLRVLSGGIAFAVGAILLARILPQSIKVASGEYQTRKWFSSALSFLFIGGTLTILNRTDIVMLGALKGTAEVGIYAIANRLSELILFSFMIGLVTLGPHFASLYAEGKIQQLQSLTTKSARVIFFFSLAITMILIGLGHWLLSIFGSEFTQGWTILSILSIGKFINAATGASAQLLNMTGHEQDTAKLTGIGAVTNIILNALLIPQWGAEGAATATTINVIFINVWLVILVYKRLGIHCTALGKISLPWQQGT